MSARTYTQSDLAGRVLIALRAGQIDPASLKYGARRKTSHIQQGVSI